MNTNKFLLLKITNQRKCELSQYLICENIIVVASRSLHICLDQVESVSIENPCLNHCSLKSIWYIYSYISHFAFSLFSLLPRNVKLTVQIITFLKADIVRNFGIYSGSCGSKTNTGNPIFYLKIKFP